MSPRGTSNANARGSAASRRVRKQFLLDTFGNGVHAACSFCSSLLTFATLTVDRITPGCEGGTYARGNIRPACQGCNSRDGNVIRERRKMVRRTGG